MKTNLALWERILRVAMGAGLMVAGVMWFQSTQTIGFRAFAVALTVLGLDFVITGAIGFCPLYHKLGWSSASGRVSRVK